MQRQYQKLPIKSKQMMFGNDRKLAPSDILEQQSSSFKAGWNNSGQMVDFLDQHARGPIPANSGSFQNQIVQQYSQAKAEPEIKAVKSTTKVSQRKLDELKNNLDNEEAVLQFLDDPQNRLEELPTDMLMELASKLKERRSQHYQEMLLIQKEQEVKQIGEQEKNKRLIMEKEKEIQEEIELA